jgi:hypothetical protein
VGVRREIQSSGSGWSNPLVVGFLLGAALLAAAFWVIETRVARPMLDLLQHHALERAACRGSRAGLVKRLMRVMMLASIHAVLLPPDEDTTADQERGPNEARKIHRVFGEAQPSEMVDRHRCEHLTGHKQDDKGRRPEPGDKENGKGDEDCAEQSTAKCPPGDAPRYGYRRNGIAQSKRE